MAQSMMKPPLIWALTGARHGDNAQVMVLAQATAARTGGELVEKPLNYNALRLLPNTLIPPSVAVLDNVSRAIIAGGPWPDLVICVGRRSVPVARWIQAQSGNRTRLVWLGRPRAPLAWFDLALSTAQYGLPESDNVTTLDLPPTMPPAPPENLERWQKEFADLPRPLTAVLVGGARWPIHFNSLDAARLGQVVENERAQTGGAWIVSTSPRTGEKPARALQAALEKPGKFYGWSAQTAAKDNPHRALLALADRFIVTADSASMIAEAVRSGKPVTLVPMRRSPVALRWRADAGLARILTEKGLMSPPRNMEAFCTRLLKAGAVRLPGQEEGRLLSLWKENGQEEVLTRIEALLAT